MYNSPKRILFLDVTAPKPYDLHTLLNEPQGGTESTVTRVAEGLARRGYQVTVGQKVRQEPGAGEAAYLPLDEALETEKPHTTIGLRNSLLVPEMKERFPDAKRVLWLHDFNQNEIVSNYDSLKGTDTKIICVSRTHKTSIASELIGRIGVVEGLTVGFIYNPIADDLVPDSTPIDPKKLVFFSSPHKGLEHALYLFSRLRSVDPSFTLHIANPGYIASPDLQADGIVNLGALSHTSVIHVVRSALAVFHPNLVFPETFGLVHAEANAVGTPVLTATLGANREILGSHPVQTVPVRDEKTVIDTILRWSAERPVVRGNPDFKLGNVLDAWEQKLNG